MTHIIETSTLDTILTLLGEIISKLMQQPIIHTCWDYLCLPFEFCLKEIGGWLGTFICFIMVVVLGHILYYLIQFTRGLGRNILYAIIIGIAPASVIGWILDSIGAYIITIIIFALFGLLYAIYDFWKSHQPTEKELWDPLKVIND